MRLKLIAASLLAAAAWADITTDVRGALAKSNLPLAESLVQKAHVVCPYSNATRGNIDVRLLVASG